MSVTNNIYQKQGKFVHVNVFICCKHINIIYVPFTVTVFVHVSVHICCRHININAPFTVTQSFLNSSDLYFLGAFHSKRSSYASQYIQIYLFSCQLPIIFTKNIKYHVFNAVTNSELTELVPVLDLGGRKS
jgi:hypothetical protein